MSPNGSVPPIYVPPGYVSQVLILYYFHSNVTDWDLVELSTALISAFHVLVCLSSVDHRRERSAAGSGFTSAARVPPRGPLPSPPPSTSTPCSPTCLHPTPCHDAPTTPPVYRHSGGCGWHELTVYLPVSSGSYLLRTGWVRASWLWALLLYQDVIYLPLTLNLHSWVVQSWPESNCLVFQFLNFMGFISLLPRLFVCHFISTREFAIFWPALWLPDSCLRLYKLISVAFLFLQSLQNLTPYMDAPRLFTETTELAKHTSACRRNWRSVREVEEEGR